VGHTGQIIHPQESPAIAKRKPPSQRPENQMDETAQAIARLREEAKGEKADKPGRAEAQDLKSKLAHAPAGAGNRKAPQVAPQSATRRQKSGGA